jgi:anti-sigma B factor antagonist
MEKESPLLFSAMARVYYRKTISSPDLLDLRATPDPGSASSMSEVPRMPEDSPSPSPSPFSCKDHPSALNISARASRDAIVLAFSGEADAAAGPLLCHALTQATAYGHTRIEIDLADLEFIDTHCLSILFDTHQELQASGGELVLCSPQPTVRRLIDILERQDLIDLS